MVFGVRGLTLGSFWYRFAVLGGSLGSLGVSLGSLGQPKGNFLDFGTSFVEPPTLDFILEKFSMFV